MSELLKKYESLDQSKLNEGTIKILNRVKTITADFTADDAKNNKIAEDVLNEVMKKNPNAVKIVKRTPKAKTAPKKTHKATHTTKGTHTTSSTAKTSNNIMSVTKEIQKAGESWKDAMERAKAVIKERKEKVVQKQKTELEKLYNLVKTKKELQGFANSDIRRDSVREAKVRGARFVTKEGNTSNKYGTFPNKLGRKYWETRDRHADRLAPNYPKDMPLLASGGGVGSKRYFLVKMEDEQAVNKVDKLLQKECGDYEHYEVGNQNGKIYRFDIEDIKKWNEMVESGHKNYKKLIDYGHLFAELDLLSSNNRKVLVWETDTKSWKKNYGTKYADGGMMDNMSIHNSTDFFNTPVYAKGGGLDRDTHEKEVKFLKAKKFTDIKTTDYDSTVKFGNTDNDEVIFASIGKKDDGYGKTGYGIAYFYQNEDNGVSSISKEILDEIASLYNGSKVELFTNAGVDLHSTNRNMYKNIYVRRVPYDRFDSYADGGAIDGGMNNLTIQNVSFAKGGSVKKVPAYAKKRLEELREEIRAERISYGELAELQSLAQYIEPNDVELLEPAGVPEFDEDQDDYAKGGEFALYKIQQKFKYALQPKWEDEKFQTGGRKFLTFAQAQDFKKKLQGLSSSMEYKVVKVGEDEKLADGGSLPFMTDPNFGNFQNTGAFAHGGSVKKVPAYVKKRLEELRKEIRAERISYEELAELQSLAQYIEPNDVELLEPAGVPEFEEEEEEEFIDFSQYDTIAYNLTEEDAVKLADEQSEKNPNSQIVLAFTGKGFNVYVKKSSFANGGELKDFEQTVKDALKVNNKWHFISQNVDGKFVQLKMYVGTKEVDVQIFKIDGVYASMPKNYAGKRETLKMIMNNFNANYELGGAFMTTDLAGHSGGGTGGLNADMPLSGVSGTYYTGLVGETGAMSSGELFENGGGVEEWKKAVTIKVDTRQEAEKGKKLLKEYWGKSGRNFKVEKRDNKYVITYEFYLTDKMELGGVMAQNQQVINDASQSYVNYYLGEGASQGIYKDGGAIVNQYEGRTPEDIWDSFTDMQRSNFLEDHKDLIKSSFESHPKDYLSDGDLISQWRLRYKELNYFVKLRFDDHVRYGQYAKGGSLGKALYVAWSGYFDYNKYDEEKIMSALKSIGAKNIRLEKQYDNYNHPEVVVFNGNKNQAVDALNEAFGINYGILVWEKDWRAKKMSDGGFTPDVSDGTQFMSGVYANGGSVGDVSGNYYSTTDFVSQNDLMDLAKSTFGQDWESGGDYDYDTEEIKMLVKKLGGGYKIVYVDSEQREKFENAKSKYLPLLKNKSNDGDIFVIPNKKMADGGFTPDVSDGTQFMSGVYANGGSVGDDFEEVIDLGAEQYYTRRFGEVGTDSRGDVELVVVATIRDLEDYMSEDELPEDGNFELNITLVPTEEFISEEMLESANDEDSSVSDDSVVNLVNYAGGLNYNPQSRMYFESQQDALDYLMSKELKDKINTDAMLAGFVMDKQYNRAGQDNWGYLDYLMGVSDRFAKGGFVGTVEFNAGDIVWQKDEKRYAFVMNNYGDPINGSSGEIRLDTTGNTPIFTYNKDFTKETGYNLVKLGEKGDTGKFTPEVLAEMKEQGKKYLDYAKSNKGSQQKENIAYTEKVVRRTLDGEFDSMVGRAKATTSNKKGSVDYTYVPNKDVKELSVVLKGELKKLMGSDILDGVYVKNSAKSTAKSTAKVDANAVYAKMLKDAKEAKSGKTKMFTATDLKKLNLEMVQKLVEAGYTEQQIRNIIFGYAFDNEIVADNELEYDKGIFSYEDTYVKSKIEDLVEAQKNKEFAVGIEYPDFDWQGIIKKYKISSKPKDITEKPKGFSGSTENYYEVFIGENIVIGHNYGYKWLDADGKVISNYMEEDKKVSDPTKQNAWQKERGQKAGFNGGWWKIISSKIEIIDDVLKTLLAQKGSYCKEIQFYDDSLPKALKENNIAFADGGMFDNNDGYNLKDINGKKIEVGDTVKTTQQSGGLFNPNDSETGIVEKTKDAFGQESLQIRYRKQGTNYDRFILLNGKINEIVDKSSSSFEQGGFMNNVYSHGGEMESEEYGIKDEIEDMKGMMSSLFTYGGIERGSYGFDRYLSKYETILGKKLFDKIYKEELDRLNEYEVEQNVYTDSDGLTYNSLKRKFANGGKLDSGVYRVGKPTKISSILYEQKIVEIFDNGDISTASDYGRKLSDFKSQKYPIITKEQLDAQYKMANGGGTGSGFDPIKVKVALAVGLDRAIEFYDAEYPIRPYQLLEKAVRKGFITLDEINERVVDSAMTTAQDSEDMEEVGSSDETYAMQEFLDEAGFKTVFVQGRLLREYADGGFMNNVYADGGDMKNVGIQITKYFDRKKGKWIMLNDYVKTIPYSIYTDEASFTSGITGILERDGYPVLASEWKFQVVEPQYADGGMFEDNEGFMRADNNFNYRYPEMEVYVETLDEPIDLTSNVSVKSNEVVIRPINENIDLNDDKRVRATMGYTPKNRNPESFSKINPRAFEFIEDLPMPMSNTHKND